MNFKQTIAGVALAAALVLPASAADVLSVNGRDLWGPAQARLVEGGTTYVSLRTVAQALSPDAVVTWEDGTAWVRGEGVELSARPGDQWMTVNGRALYVPYQVRLEDGRTLVPVRPLAQALGAGVGWSQAAGVTLTPGAGRPGPAPYTEEDLYWMSRIISAESRGEPLLGKLAVGTVVLNRVASDEFPDTIHDVIFDRKWGVQFTPVANGTVYLEPTAESVLAAKLVLDGARAAGDSL
ncbi:MAG: copper amine oxidase, partial [Oscillospiraceae bacterium]|nr:copper amine oxidase [Oscillospiraceae bacterium]